MTTQQLQTIRNKHAKLVGHQYPATQCFQCNQWIKSDEEILTKHEKILIMRC